MTSGKPIAAIALEVDFQCQRKCWEMRLNSQQLIVNPFFSQLRSLVGVFNHPAKYESLGIIIPNMAGNEKD
jgi:hypothetical protein